MKYLIFNLHFLIFSLEKRVESPIIQKVNEMLEINTLSLKLLSEVKIFYDTNSGE